MAEDKASDQHGFTVPDFIVGALSIALSLGVGAFYGIKGRKQHTTEAYLLGNRKLMVIPVALSLSVTYQSSVLLLGSPAEIYIYGVMTIYLAVGFAIAFIVGGRIIVPLFHPLKIKSIFEYLELRYRSKGPRYVCSCIAMLNYVFYLSIVLCGLALAMETGLPSLVSFIFTATAAAMYTSLGGMKAVVWTDFVQFLTMLLGIIGIIIKATLMCGGIKSVYEINYRYGRLNILDTASFSFDPTIRHTFWNLTVGGACFYMQMVFNQSTLQRISSIKKQGDSRRVIYIAIICIVMSDIIVCSVGLAGFAYFNFIRCDPLESKQISNPNQIIPFMVLRIFNDLPGFSGLFIASLFSGVLSTLSSGYSGMSALFTEDFVKPHFRQLSDRNLTTIAKCSVLVFGVITIGVAYILVAIKGSFLQIFGSLTAAFGGPLTGIFLYSVFFPWATKQGVIIGGFTSMAFVFWISMGQSFSETLVKQPWLPASPVDQCNINDTFVTNSWYANRTSQIPSSLDIYDSEIKAFWNIQQQGLDQFYSLSYMWLSALGIITMNVIGSLVSLFVDRPATNEIDATYMMPLGDTLFPYLPTKLRNWLHFGVNFRQVRREETEGDMKQLKANEPSCTEELLNMKNSRV